MTDFNFEGLGEQLAREQDDLLAKHNVQAEVRTRIAQYDVNAVNALRKSARTATTRRMSVVWAGGGLTLAAAAALLLSLRGLPLDTAPKALSVHVAETHANVEVGQYVHVPPAKQVGLEFSDGSHIEVAEHSRARLTGLRMNGADVSLESGLMHVQVKHRTDTSWHISAGPFGVHVIGTRFDVRWKPEDDNFELTLHEGKVELSGCAFSAGYRIVAGQSVRASCKTERFDFSSASGVAAPAAGSGSVGIESFGTAQEAVPAQPEPAAETQGKAAPAPSSAPETSLAAAHKPLQHTAKSARPPEARPDFRALARAGQYAEALRAAKAAGFEQECARANARDLSLLASAARYAQDTASEAYAWRLLRERFRGTKDASIAAFALGRIEFDNHGAYAKAAEWFRTYLREQPRGDLSREALGRLLEATQHLGDQPELRELAARYLNEYPDGPHAGIAQRLRDREAAP